MSDSQISPQAAAAREAARHATGEFGVQSHTAPDSGISRATRRVHPRTLERVREAMHSVSDAESAREARDRIDAFAVEFRAGLREAREATGAEDVAVVRFARHGEESEGSGESVLTLLDREGRVLWDRRDAGWVDPRTARFLEEAEFVADAAGAGEQWARMPESARPPAGVGAGARRAMRDGDAATVFEVASREQPLGEFGLRRVDLDDRPVPDWEGMLFTGEGPGDLCVYGEGGERP